MMDWTNMAWLENVMNRRNDLYTSAPLCTNCDSQQVQLMDTGNPAKWRCRFCKHRFDWEPGVTAFVVS